MSKISSNINDMNRAGVNVQLVELLTQEGWEFWLSTWEDRHKCDEYSDLCFKSPNMKRAASVHPTYFGEMTREYLLEREAFAVSVDWADALFNHKLTIQNPISKALREYFEETKDCKFDYIYSTELDFRVMVAPKNLTKPKKVTVTIKIT